MGDIISDTVLSGIDKSALSEKSEQPIYKNGCNGNAFAFIVLHKGMPVAKAYKPQFNKDTRFLSCSMAKSFTNALLGILVNKGIMDILEPAEIEEWQEDERNRLTSDNLLRMQSGLRWNEGYGSRSDVNLMLFTEGDISKYAISCPLEYPVGTHWLYSSCTANILSYLIRNKFESDTSLFAFSNDHFFEKTRITDAIFEVDASVDLEGSSNLYATARDYSRFDYCIKISGFSVTNSSCLKAGLNKDSFIGKQ
jgi:CubicO group peptidase (beta-lactamase class C family)